MDPREERFLRALEVGSARMGIASSALLRDGLVVHYRLLLKWNEKLNLTNITDPVQAAELHALDSLLLAARFAEDEETQVLDLGSGGGFPGIPLLLARPRLRVTLLEPRRKRASFLRVVLAELKRADVGVLEQHLKENSQLEFAAGALVSRATLPAAELLPIAAPQLLPGGRLYLMAGAHSLSEADLSALAAPRFRLGKRTRSSLPSGETRVIDELLRND